MYRRTSYLSNPKILIQEALSELEIPPDPSEISIQGNFTKLYILRSGENFTKKLCREWFGVFNSWFRTRSHWSGENISVFRIVEVGRRLGSVAHRRHVIKQFYRIYEMVKVSNSKMFEPRNRSCTCSGNCHWILKSFLPPVPSVDEGRRWTGNLLCELPGSLLPLSRQT